MSKHKVPSLDRSKGTTEQSVNSYQSVWMGHWKGPKLPPPCKANCLSLNYETRENASDAISGQEMTSCPSGVPKIDNRFCEVPVTTTLSVVDGNALSTVKNGGAPSSNHEAWIPLGVQSKNPIEGSAHGSEQLFKSANFVGKESIFVSTSFQESPLRSSSRHVPRNLDTEGKSLTFSIDKLDHHASINTPSLWSRPSLLQNDHLTTGQKRLPVFPSQSSHPEATKRDMFCSEYSSRQSHSVVDVQTMRIRASVDSVEGMTNGQPKLSQTGQQMFFSEKNDADLSTRGRICPGSTVSTNYQANSTFGQFLSLSTDVNYHGNPGVKLQQLWSSTGSEGHENLADVRTSTIPAKNESSAETNTLDMDALPENSLTGEASSWPEKGDSAREGSHSLVKVDLCERKRKFFTLAAISSSADNRETSPSKTRSLEMEHLLPPDDQGSHLNPNAQHSDHRGPEQRYGWLKRLKATASGHHTESLKTGEASPVQKANNLSGGISKQRNTISEPIMAATLNKQIVGSGQSALLAKDGVRVSTSGDTTRGNGLDALLSNPWIQRWSRNQAAVLQKKQEPVVLCEPLSTKVFDELRKKQFPSIAAMALMGKAMNGFHPCEFMKRGSFVFWNT